MPLVLSGTDGISTNGTSHALVLDSSGRVRTPFTPAFKAGRSGAYTPGAVEIIFNQTTGSTHFNNGGHYNSSNGRFTAPVAGTYFFTTLIIWEQMPNNTSMDDCMYIYKNGSNITYSFRRATHVSNSTGVGSYYTDFANVVVDLAVNDYVSVYNAFASRIVHGNSNYTWFAGFLIG